MLNGGTMICTGVGTNTTGVVDVAVVVVGAAAVMDSAPPTKLIA